MPSPLTAELARRAFQRGLLSSEALMLAVAIVVAWNEQRDQSSGRALFKGLASHLVSADGGDGVTAARHWLADPGLSSAEWQFVDDSLRFLQQEAVGPLNWNAEVAYCLSPEHRQGDTLSLPLARSVARLLDLPLHGTVACLFPASASIAWVLAEERDVTLYADQSVAIVLALLARAACRPLKVRRENPLDGSFMPAPYVHEAPDRRPPFDCYDHILSVPPFGGRVTDGPSKGMPFESYQVARLSPRARKSFSTLIPDGFLFRETKAETGLRADLVSQNGVTLLSLPSGMFWPVTAISTSLLHLEPGQSGTVRMIDGRSMEKSSIGRVQEGLIVQHLERFRGLRPQEPERAVTVTTEELADNSFSLLPDRYVKSGSLSALERALEQRPVVALTDIAEIERGKAPVPLRELDEDPPLTAMEIAPADVVDGIVRAPTRQQAFDLKERARVQGVTVRPDDILVSIKGNVGNVGMVGLNALLAEQLNDPWIVSQSLAIIRWKPNPHVPSPAILNALLTAPWVREKLESMSGATTVRTLPMSALRTLTIPIPTREECAQVEEVLDEIADLREQIANHQRNLAERQRQLWAQLWQVPVNLGDE